jgi:hypothetical protein
MNHDEAYPPEYLADILKSVKTIAMVGASSDPTKFSYGVLRVLHETGYDNVRRRRQRRVRAAAVHPGAEGLCALTHAADRAIFRTDPVF